MDAMKKTICLLALAILCGCEDEKKGERKRESVEKPIGLKSYEWSLPSTPQIEGKDAAGKPMKLSEHKGKVIALDFWATWCGPCKMLIPHEKALVKKMEDRPFVLLGIALDQNRDKLLAFEKEQQLPWRSWSDPMGELSSDWEIGPIPTLILIDHEGTIRYRFIGADPRTTAAFEAAVEQLVENAEAASK